MATLYSDVYGSFFSKISDYDIIKLDQDDIDDYLYDLMISAITRFSKICKTDLSDRNDETNQFNVDLSDIEIDIISEIMVENWFKPKLNNTDLLRQNLGTKDFSAFSNANLLKAIRETYMLAHSRSENMMNRYSFDINDIRKIGENDDN